MNAFWTPTGLYVTVREEIGRPDWIVRVLNFSTYKHRRYEFADEHTAREYAQQWTI